MHDTRLCRLRSKTGSDLRVVTMYRSAPLMAFALRQLGATVGKNLQCAHDAALSGPLDLISIGDDVAIQTGAYIQTTRWLGQETIFQSGEKTAILAGVHEAGDQAALQNHR